MILLWINIFKNPTVFRGTFSVIRTDLIASISSTVIDRITTKNTNTQFVVIVSDEILDVVCKFQCSIILPFIDENCLVQERFLIFSDVNTDRTASTSFKQVHSTFPVFQCDKKKKTYS